MEIKKYKEKYPYELTENGELKKSIYELNNKRYVYLTDEQYDKLKNLADNTKKICDLLDQKKETYVKILRGAIQKVQND